MAEFPSPDLHHLRAAEGWLELGNHVEALTELDQVSPAHQDCLEALGLRWSIFARFKRWEECVLLAAQIIAVAPDNVFGWIHRSFALHELRRTQEACDLLRPAAKQFPRNETIPYNLACYECQLGRLPEARKWLKKAMARSDPEEIKLQALADADLQPMWPEIARQPTQ